MNKSLLYLIVLSTCVLKANNNHISSAHDYQLYYKNKQWEIEREGHRHIIQKCFVDKMLRDIPEDKAEEFLKHVAIRLSQMDNGEFALRGHVRGLGGGPITGAILYWVTKTVCYGTAVAAAGGAVVATGGAAGAVTGAIAASATAGASVGATVVGGAIAGAGMATEAGMATAAVVTSAGGLAAAAAAVESASIAAGALGTAIPFLP